MSDPLTAGLLGVAKRWSAIGLVAGLAFGFALGIGDIVAWTVTRQALMVAHFHSLTLVAIVLLTVCSLLVHVTARVMVYLRRMKFTLLDEIRQGSTDSPSPETLAAVRRLALRVVSDG